MAVSPSTAAPADPSPAAAAVVRVAADRRLAFLLGGASCMIAACVTNPIDVIKTRLQLDGELGRAQREYGGLLGTSMRIAQQEGIVGLYKGLVPSLLREASYSSLRVGLYDHLRELLGHDPLNPGATALWKKVVAGLGAGAAGAAIANPTDLVKVRLQADRSSGGGGERRYRGTLHAFQSIIRDEGVVRGLYRGVGPTTQRAALLTASQMASYDHIKHGVVRLTGRPDGPLVHALASMAAGLVASLVTSPVDLIKTRVMSQPVDAAGRPTRYAGTIDCLVQSLRAEGFFGLYKGFLANWMRIGPHTIVTFLAYERLRRWFGLVPV